MALKNNKKDRDRKIKEKKEMEQRLQSMKIDPKYRIVEDAE